MKTTNNTNSVRFVINFFDKTITGTKASFDKASKGVGDAYEELTSKMNAHPTFTLVVKEPKHKATKAKQTYNGLTFEIMKAHIEGKPDKDVRLEEMKDIRDTAKTMGRSAYPIVKKWFLDLYKSDFQNAENKRFNAGKVATKSVIHKAIQVKAVEATAQTPNPVDNLKKSA